MSQPPPEQRRPGQSLEIKAGSITVPILRLYTTNLDLIGTQLEQKLGRAPDFFRNAPVIIDIGELGAAAGDILNFAELARLIRERDLVPVGVRGGPPEQQAAARAAHLAVLSELKPPPSAPAAAAGGNRPSATRMIIQPVRSGQRIYAPGGDLIVMAQVSPGAEIMADGNIHVYASLRGRALAGVQGDIEARIFCSDLQAELVAIGGHYQISENLDASLRGRPIQVYLKDNALIIDPLQPAHS
jgi:septum site-determining protein MinC